MRPEVLRTAETASDFVTSSGLAVFDIAGLDLSGLDISGLDISGLTVESCMAVDRSFCGAPVAET